MQIVVQPAGEGDGSVAHALGDFLGRAATRAGDDLEEALLAEQFTPPATETPTP